MYRRILVALENSASDLAVLPHVSELATHFHAKVCLLHVADGWVARNFDQLKLAESEEMREDRTYLEGIAAELRLKGIEVSTVLSKGNPPDEILKAVEREQCDLIAMTSHGHRWLADIFFGSTISAVRHKASVPLFLIRASANQPGAGKIGSAPSMASGQ